MRWNLRLTSSETLYPNKRLSVGYRVSDEVRRRFHLKLWNVYNFFVTYANLDAWRPKAYSVERMAYSKNVLDKWILIRLNQTLEIVTDSLEKYDAYVASSEIERFVDDLSLWYIRRSRDRVGPAADSEMDKSAFYHTTYYILHNTSRLLAPFVPFIADLIYKNLTREESVHLSSWLSAKILSHNDIKLLEEMQTARQVVEKAHAIRKEKAIPVRQPLISFSTTFKPISKNLEYLVKDEINVKSILWNSKLDKLDTKITKELEEEMRVRELIRNIQEKRRSMNLNLTQRVEVKNEWLPSDIKLTQWLIKKAQIERIGKGKFNVRLSSKR